MAQRPPVKYFHGCTFPESCVDDDMYPEKPVATRCLHMLLLQDLTNTELSRGNIAAASHGSSLVTRFVQFQ